MGKEMNKEKLNFLCEVCKCPSEIDLKNIEKDIFEIVALDEIMEWSDFSDEVPNLNTTIWERSINTPIKGEIKKVQVHFPFNMSPGEDFWTLFMPALSHFNGWDEYPEEINTSAIIKCNFERIISKNEEKAWINIKIEDVILLSEICDNFEPRKDSTGYLMSLNDFNNIDMNDLGEWILFTDSAQGDLGTWGLVKKHGNNKNSLVLYCKWDFHSDILYCGNIDISNEELNYLINLASK